MSRSPLLLLTSLLIAAAAGCSNPAAKQDTGKVAEGGGGTQEVVAVPGADQVPPPNMKGAGPGATIGGTDGARTGAPAGDDPFKLKPEEGQLAIEPPAQVKAGTEVAAKVTVTPAGPYKINTEFPTKLELQAPAGVTVAKATLTAGGHDKAQGDADAFDDKQLAFTVKLTPGQSGTHTINGTFKFAVCDKDTCLAKKEQITIAVAAN